MNRIISTCAAMLALGSPAIANAQSATVEATAEVIPVESTVSLVTTRALDFGRVTIPTGAIQYCTYLVAVDPLQQVSTVGTKLNQSNVIGGAGEGVDSTVPRACAFLDTPTLGAVEVNCGVYQAISYSINFSQTTAALANNIAFTHPFPSGAIRADDCTDDGMAEIFIGGRLYVPGDATELTGPVGSTTLTVIF